MVYQASKILRIFFFVLCSNGRLLLVNNFFEDLVTSQVAILLKQELEWRWLSSFCICHSLVVSRYSKPMHGWNFGAYNWPIVFVACQRGIVDRMYEEIIWAAQRGISS